MPTNRSNGSWDEYARLVLSELKRLNESVETLRTDLVEREKELTEELHKTREELKEQITEVRTEVQDVHREFSIKVERLDVRYSLLGLAAGSLPTIGYVIYQLLK